MLRQLKLGLMDIAQHIFLFLIWNLMIGSITVLSALSFTSLIEEVDRLNWGNQWVQANQNIVDFEAIPSSYVKPSNEKIAKFIELLESTDNVSYNRDYHLSEVAGSSIYKIYGNSKLIDPNFNETGIRLYTNNTNLDYSLLGVRDDQVRYLELGVADNCILREINPEKSLSFLMSDYSELINESSEFFELYGALDSLKIRSQDKENVDEIIDLSDTLGISLRRQERFDPTKEFKFILTFNVPIVIGILCFFFLCSYAMIKQFINQKSREIAIHQVSGSSRSDALVRVGVWLLSSNALIIAFFTVVNPGVIKGLSTTVLILTTFMYVGLLVLVAHLMSDKYLNRKLMEDVYHDYS